ncbi:MAG: demethoxyubiquinone hydroxylase family protein [Rhodospirillales bacterium]|nr:demethoxyubiquinone hydroxylase family protein [Rhodospirillales bacterium]
MTGPTPKTSAEDRMPGDPSRDEIIKRMIRVDHAGEYGAVRIYAGQQAVLRDGETASLVRDMAAKEAEHLARFDKIVGDRDVRPTALMPLWHVAGFALGAATALMGEKAAMACTAAVEEVIDEHYASQSARLGQDEAELRATIEEFRADEAAHREEALKAGAEDAPGYEILSTAIKTGSRLAIWLSTRI